MSLDLDFAARRCPISLWEHFPSFCRNLNLIGNAFGFHPACDVYGIPPEIIREFLFADHAGDNCAGMHTDSEFKVDIIVPTKLSKGLLHSQCQVSDFLGMISDAAF